MKKLSVKEAYALSREAGFVHATHSKFKTVREFDILDILQIAYQSLFGVQVKASSVRDFYNQVLSDEAMFGNTNNGGNYYGIHNAWYSPTFPASQMPLVKIPPMPPIRQQIQRHILVR